jgi:hypothetical protein
MNPWPHGKCLSLSHTPHAGINSEGGDVAFAKEWDVGRFGRVVKVTPQG